MASQKVKTDEYGNDWYAIYNDYTGKCLDVRGRSHRNGANIILYSCHYDDNQLFRLMDYGEQDGYRVVAFMNKESCKCLDIRGRSYYNRGNLQQWQCHYGENQQFTLKY